MADEIMWDAEAAVPVGDRLELQRGLRGSLPRDLRAAWDGATSTESIRVECYIADSVQ